MVFWKRGYAKNKNKRAEIHYHIMYFKKKKNYPVRFKLNSKYDTPRNMKKERI